MICTTTDVAGRLNAFQRVMYHWSALHPYNATHTYKIAGPLDVERLRAAIRETYARNGVGIVHVDPDARWYQHETDSEPEVQILQAGDDTEGRLTEHVRAELNRPFDRPSCRPLRFFAMAAGPAAHYVSTTYDHWLADSVAARLLLRHVLGRYCGLDLAENRQALELYPATYREIFGRRLRGLPLALAAARSLGRWRRNRTAWQVAYASVTQMAVGYQLYATAPGTVAQVRGLAHAVGATVHDVILAALARAMAEFLPRRSSRGKSQELALGSIVDTRPDAGEDLSSTFGMFLAYYVVRCGQDRQASLADTARRVAELTRPIKQRQSYLDTVVNMQFVNSVWPYVREHVKPHFMRKALPMTAGVSNVLLREPWIDRHREQILGYSRGSPTGPMLPLVLAPTTLGDQMSVGVTYRVTGFPQAKMDGIMEMFLDQIEHPHRAAHAAAPHLHQPRMAVAVG